MTGISHKLQQLPGNHIMKMWALTHCTYKWKYWLPSTSLQNKFGEKNNNNNNNNNYNNVYVYIYKAEGDDRKKEYIKQHKQRQQQKRKQNGMSMKVFVHFPVQFNLFHFNPAQLCLAGYSSVVFTLLFCHALIFYNYGELFHCC